MLICYDSVVRSSWSNGGGCGCVFRFLFGWITHCRIMWSGHLWRRLVHHEGVPNHCCRAFGSGGRRIFGFVFGSSGVIRCKNKKMKVQTDI